MYRGEADKRGDMGRELKLRAIQGIVWRPTVVGDPHTTQDFSKNRGCFPQTENKILLLKTALTQFTENGEDELLPAQNLLHCVLVSLVQIQEDTLHTAKREMQTPIQFQTLLFTILSKICYDNCGITLFEKNHI